jgi:hypothetical protein
VKYLRVIDQAGNGSDYETEFVPHVGERILHEYGIAKGPVGPHYFRVKDVMYRLQEKPDIQVAILVEEELDATAWPE